MKTRLVISLGLLLASVVAAILIRIRPGQNFVDDWGFRLISHQIFVSWPWEVDTNPIITVVLGIVSVIAAATVARRDRRRSVACIAGPVLAGFMTVIVLKPLSGKTLGGALAFPSGLVVGVSALVAVVLLVLPGWWRLAALGPATAIVVFMMWLVVAMRWHYPSDALTGAAVGVGSVVFADAAFHIVPSGVLRRWDGRHGQTGAVG
jgi:membrane-associated phospholipid phosphatase